jgi:hypothetical protein
MYFYDHPTHIRTFRPNSDLKNEVLFPFRHCEVVATVAIRRSRCEGGTRGNLNEIPRSARNDTSCQVLPYLPAGRVLLAMTIS